MQCEICSNKILCILILDCTIYVYLILVIEYIFILNNIRMKKFMRIAFVAAFAAIAGYGVYTNLKTDVMSDLALANVEALSRNEVDQIKCNQAMGGTCVLINNTPIPGEKYN